MNRWLASAGALGIFTAFVHLVAGGADILAPFLEAPLPPEVKGTLHACWHMVTVLLFTSGAALFASAFSKRPGAATLARFLGAQYLGHGSVFLAVAWLGRGGIGPWALPQWALLLPVGALALAGARKSSSSSMRGYSHPPGPEVPGYADKAG